MSSVKAQSGATCKRCGKSAGPGEASAFHSADDPLQVVECPHCGSILDIGGHRW